MTDKELKVIKDILKKYGEGAIMKLGDATFVKTDSIPTGSLSLDTCIGVGGIPRGRITEIYGWESSGKTTVCLHTAANAQKKKLRVAYIDVENALDPEYARRLGVDVDNLYVSQPNSAEEALDIVEQYVRSEDFGLVILDSIAALTPRAENEGEMGDSHMGLQARLMSQAMRKLQAVINKSNTAVLFTNQMRMKIGVLYGNPETTSGGNAMKFAASVRIKVRRKEVIKSGTDIIGSLVHAKVEKNKLAPPFRECEFEVMFNEGISRYGELVDLGVQFGVIDKRGAFYSLGDDRLGQGKENSKQYLKEHTDVADSIEAQVRKAIDDTKHGMVLAKSEPDVDEETGEIA